MVLGLMLKYGVNSLPLVPLNKMKVVTFGCPKTVVGSIFKSNQPGCKGLDVHRYVDTDKGTIDLVPEVPTAHTNGHYWGSCVGAMALENPSGKYEVVWHKGDWPAHPPVNVLNLKEAKAQVEQHMIG